MSHIRKTKEILIEEFNSQSKDINNNESDFISIKKFIDYLDGAIGFVANDINFKIKQYKFDVFYSSTDKYDMININGKDIDFITISNGWGYTWAVVFQMKTWEDRRYYRDCEFKMYRNYSNR